jgi:hypothetical protein
LAVVVFAATGINSDAGAGFWFALALLGSTLLSSDGLEAA